MLILPLDDFDDADKVLPQVRDIGHMTVLNVAMVQAGR